MESVVELESGFKLGSKCVSRGSGEIQGQGKGNPFSPS